MENILLLDTSALVYAYKAGGLSLLDEYAQYAATFGYHLVVTDVVAQEIAKGPQATELQGWLEQQGITPQSTPEGTLYNQYEAGSAPANYSPKDAGDRSIAEYAQSTIADGGTAAIYSDDGFFQNPQLLQPYGLSPNRNLTNADMLNGAAVTGTISADEFSGFVSGFKANANAYNPSKNGYSPRLSTFLSSNQLAGEAPAAGEAPVLLKLLSAGDSLLKLTGVTLIAIDALTTAAKAAGDVAAGDDLDAEEEVAAFGARLAGGLAGAEALGAALGGVGTLVGGPIGGAVGGLAGGVIGGVVGATLGQAAVSTLWNQVTNSGGASSSGSGTSVDPRFQDNTLHVYGNSDLSALQSQMYQAGYSTPQVNYVVQSVQTELSLLQQTNPNATASDALDALASAAQSQTYNSLGSLDVVAGNGSDPTGVTSLIGAPANGTAPITTSLFDTNVSASPFAQVQYTPDPSGTGQYAVTYTGNGGTATVSNTTIDPTQVTPTTNGTFTVGSSQPDSFGYTNQLSLAATSTFGINGLNVTDPTTGQTTSVPLDNGSATTLKEGRSVATDAPNELVSTTQPSGSTTDTAFGQGATVTDPNATVNAATPGGSVNLATTGNTLEGTGATFTMAGGLANASYTLGGTDATLNLNPNATTSATVDGVNARVTGDSGNDAVTLAGTGTSATVDGGGQVGLSASNQTLTLGDAGTTVQVASNLQSETIAGSGVIVNADGLVYGNLVGDDNTFNDTSNGGTYYGLAGTGDVVNGTNDGFEDLYAGTLTLQGAGDSVNLHTSDDTIYASAGDTIQAAAGSSGDTFYASGVTLNADGLNGSNLFGDDNVVNLQGSGNSGVGFTGTGDVVTAQGDFINDGAASLTLNGGGNTISLRWRFHTPGLLHGHVTSVN